MSGLNERLIQTSLEGLLLQLDRLKQHHEIGDLRDVAETIAKAMWSDEIVSRAWYIKIPAIWYDESDHTVVFEWNDGMAIMTITCEACGYSEPSWLDYGFAESDSSGKITITHGAVWNNVESLSDLMATWGKSTWGRAMNAETKA